MLKKIHTIYAILAELLVTSMFFCRFATIIGPEGAELKIMYFEKLPYLVMLIMLLAAGESLRTLIIDAYRFSDMAWCRFPEIQK